MEDFIKVLKSLSVDEADKADLEDAIAKLEGKMIVTFVNEFNVLKPEEAKPNDDCSESTVVSLVLLGATAARSLVLLGAAPTPTVVHPTPRAASKASVINFFAIFIMHLSFWINFYIDNRTECLHGLSLNKIITMIIIYHSTG